jgi:hypothetical protein
MLCLCEQTIIKTSLVSKAAHLSNMCITFHNLYLIHIAHDSSQLFQPQKTQNIKKITQYMMKVSDEDMNRWM